MDIIEFDYKEHLDNYEKKRKREEEDREKRLELAQIMEQSLELMRISKKLIQQNSPNWEKLKELKAWEKEKSERLEKAQLKKQTTL